MPVSFSFTFTTFIVGNSFSTFKDQNGDKEISIINSFFVNQTNLVTHSYEGSYTNVNVLVNGGTESHVNNSRGPSSNGHQSLTIGRPNNSTTHHFGNFEIAEVIVISSTDSQKIIEIQNYLSNKWNLTSTVDSDGDGMMDADDPEPTIPLVAWYQFNDSSDSLTFLKEEDENNEQIHIVDEGINYLKNLLIIFSMLTVRNFLHMFLLHSYQLQIRFFYSTYSSKFR